MVAIFPVAWVITAPFATAAVIAACRPANALAARRLGLTLTLGWLGIALLVVGAFVGRDAAGTAMLLLGAPLAGLSFWMRAPGGGDDDPPDDPEPPPEDWDWDRFLSDLEDWRRRRASRPLA